MICCWLTPPCNSDSSAVLQGLFHLVEKKGGWIAPRHQVLQEVFKQCKTVFCFPVFKQFSKPPSEANCGTSGGWAHGGYSSTLIKFAFTNFDPRQCSHMTFKPDSINFQETIASDIIYFFGSHLSFDKLSQQLGPCAPNFQTNSIFQGSHFSLSRQFSHVTRWGWLNRLLVGWGSLMDKIIFPTTLNSVSFRVNFQDMTILAYDFEVLIPVTSIQK